MAISLTATTIYDVDQDVDIEAQRIDLVDDEEVLAYVPKDSPYKTVVIEALKQLDHELQYSDIGPADSLADTIQP